MAMTEKQIWERLVRLWTLRGKTAPALPEFLKRLRKKGLYGFNCRVFAGRQDIVAALKHVDGSALEDVWSVNAKGQRALRLCPDAADKAFEMTLLKMKMLGLGAKNAVAVPVKGNRLRLLPAELLLGNTPLLQSWQLLPDDKASAWPGIPEAVGLIHAALSPAACADNRLWARFRFVPFGWNIPVIIDETATLDEREKSPGDLLGLYVHDRSSSHIVLFVRAIDEFLSRRPDLRPDEHRVNMYAAVLAHELFHGWQDFHVCLSETAGSAGHLSGIPDIETFAEYFSLRFVKDCPGDLALYDALCASRRAQLAPGNRCRDYAMALTAFGDIDDDASRNEFLRLLRKWRTACLSR